ncbi:MAG: hypothetical protein AAGA93_03635 [Actinomycetota bacterium]
MASRATPSQSTPPPASRPPTSRPDEGSGPRQARRRTGRRFGLVVIALAVTALLVAGGLLAGVVWVFGSCFADPCSTVDALAVLWVPALGLGIGIAASYLLYRRRRWFDAHPVVLWTSSLLALAVLVLLGTVVLV